jgi:hypothetical protein
VPWLGVKVSRETILAIRAFETWIHADDIRRALGRALEPPNAVHLHRMADFSMQNLPAWLEVSGRAHPGRVARIVLTGAGGGSWLVPLSLGDSLGDADHMENVGVESADVVLEADVVAWCHRVGERVTTEDITVRVSGHDELATDILEAASALAML